jgi:hypothetical protein
MLDHLLKLAPQIRNILSLGRLLATLNHSLLVDLLCLLAHDPHLVVSTIVVVPDLTPGNRRPHRKVQGLLLRPGKNVCELDCKHKPVKDAVRERLLVAGCDLGCCLPLVEREAHRNPFLKCEIAQANNAFDCGSNQVDALDNNVTRIFGQR